MSILTNVLKHRPNARVLILEALPQDAAMLADYVLAHPPIKRLTAGPDHRDQVLIMAVGHYSQNKKRMGPVDFVIVNNRYNMRRVDSHDKYKGILRHLLALRNPPQIAVIPPEPVLGLAPVRSEGWLCGEPYPTKTRPMSLIAQDGEYSPCGARNADGLWFCRSCGTFRGLIYRGF